MYFRFYAEYVSHLEGSINIEKWNLWEHLDWMNPNEIERRRNELFSCNGGFTYSKIRINIIFILDNCIEASNISLHKNIQQN